MDGNHKTQDFLWGALVGGAVGALTSMLFTTKKGEQFRNEITDKYHELKDKAKDMAENAKDTVETHAKKAANALKKDD